MRYQRPATSLDDLLHAATRLPPLGTTRFDVNRERLPMPPTLMGARHGENRQSTKDGAPARRRAPSAPVPAGIPSAKAMLGSLARAYEAPNGPGTVNDGRGDPGGASYGSWQLSTAAGMPQAFLRADGAGWAPYFRGMRAGSPAFNAAWPRATAPNPIAFENAQRAFVR